MALGAVGIGAIKVAAKLFGAVKKGIEKRKAKRAERFERRQAKLSERENELAKIQQRYFNAQGIGGIDNLPDNQTADQVSAYGLDLLRRKAVKDDDQDVGMVTLAKNVGIKDEAKKGLNMIMLGLGAIVLLLLFRKK